MFILPFASSVDLNSPITSLSLLSQKDTPKRCDPAHFSEKLNFNEK